PDDAGTLDGREHLGHAPERAPHAERSVDFVLVVHAVLEREHGRVGAEDGPQATGRVLRIERLDAEDDGVSPRDTLETLDHRRTDDAVALDRRADSEARAAHRFEVRAARHHRQRGAPTQELRAEIAADATRPHHHDVHETYDTLRASTASLERRASVPPR